MSWQCHVKPAFLLAAFVSLAAACGGSTNDQAFNPFSSFAPAENLPAVRAIEEPMYPLPSPLTSGTYHPEYPNDAAADAVAKYGFRPMDKDEANGITTFDDLGDASKFRNSCGDDDLWKFEEMQAIEFRHLPPGAYASGPQWAVVCPDGSVAAVGQSLYAGPTDFTVSFSVGPKGLHYFGDHAGKFAGEIAGHPSVFVAESYTGQDGEFGMSYANGVMILTVHGMPMDDAIAVAEGIHCEQCDSTARPSSAS